MSPISLAGIVIAATALILPAEEHEFTVHLPPPPKCEFPAINEFFAFGAYASNPYPYDEMWMSKHLNRTTKEAVERHYRHLRLHNINFFHNNFRSRTPDLAHLLDCAKRYGGQHDIKIYVGKLKHRASKVPRGKARWPLEDVIGFWTRLVERYAQNPNIHVWRIYDEISVHRDYEQTYVYALKKAIYEKDQNHPISYIEHGGPSPATPQLEYGMYDVYPFYGVTLSGRDLSRFEKHINRCPEPYLKQKIRHIVVWAAFSGTYEVNRAEVRAQVYHSLVNGFNGISFYYAPIRMPAWSHWEKSDPLAKKFRVASLRDYGLSSSFEYETEMLKEVSDLGRKLIPLGHLFLQGIYQPDSGIPVESETCGIERSGEHPEFGYWQVEAKPLPALGLGRWKLGTSDLLVVYNRDLKNRRSGVLDLRASIRDRQTFDLFQMKEETVDDGRLKATLDPGDSVLFLLASREDFAKHRRLIEKARYELESKKLRIRTDMARGSGLLELVSVDEALTESKKLHEQERYSEANERLQASKKLLAKSKDSNQDFIAIERSIRAANDLLWQIDLWTKRRMPYLQQDEVDMGSWKYSPPIGTGRPRLEAILTKVRAAGPRYFPLAISFEKGTHKNPDVFTDYVKELKNILEELRSYRPRVCPSQRVGFLTLNGQYDRDAWTFLQLTTPNCRLIKLGKSGRLKDFGGKNLKSSDLDLIWWHYAEPIGNAWLDEGRKIRAPSKIVNETALGSMKEFLGEGKGLLLSGLAVPLVCRLGIEEVEPNVIEIGQTDFVKDVFKSGLLYQGVGVRSVLSAREHPVFNGLGGEAFFRHDSAIEPISRATWVYPSIPRNGSVLGGLVLAIAPPPDKYHYDLVEFRHGENGRVITCGLPKLRFDVNFKRIDMATKRFQNLIRFMHNIFEHLGNSKRAPFVRTPIEGPFHHPDFARLEDFPNLKIKVSSGENPEAPFVKKVGPFYYWRTTDVPAWLEIDFGETIEIQKLNLMSHWISHTNYTIQHFRLQVWNETSKKFEDCQPGIEFHSADHRASYHGITFTFEPMKLKGGIVLDMKPIIARKIRFTDMRGVLFVNPDQKGLGVSNVIVYGRRLGEAAK